MLTALRNCDAFLLGCPFCIRDTNGSYSHGEDSGATNKWTGPNRQTIDGVEVDVWNGVAVSTSSTTPFALGTAVGFLPDGVTPAFVNV